MLTMEKPSGTNDEQQPINSNELRKKLDDALRRGNVEELEALFNSGMDIDQTDWEGRTALQMVSYRGNKSAVEMLLARGANVNAVFMYQGRVPQTALDAAREANKSEVVEALLAHGAKTGREIVPPS